MVNCLLALRLHSFSKILYQIDLLREKTSSSCKAVGCYVTLNLMYIVFCKFCASILFVNMIATCHYLRTIWKYTLATAS